MAGAVFAVESELTEINTKILINVGIPERDGNEGELLSYQQAMLRDRRRRRVGGKEEEVDHYVEIG